MTTSPLILFAQAPIDPNLLLVCVTGIVVAILVPPIWLFVGMYTGKISADRQHQLILIEIAFGLTAIMALLFGIQSDLTAQVPISLRVGGPFAAFLGTVVLLIYFYKGDPQVPEDSKILQAATDTIAKTLPGELVAAMKDAVPGVLATAIQADLSIKLVDATKDAVANGLTGGVKDKVYQQLAQAFEEAETNNGWISYSAFKGTLEDFEELREKEEEYFVRNLLGAGYAPNPGVQIKSATIVTAFVYLSNVKEKSSVVKLQRVSGEVAELGAQVRFRSFSSYGTRGVKSAILISQGVDPIEIRSSDADSEPLGREKDPRAKIHTRNFDYLILTKYPEYPEHDDYLLVDASRFCQEGNPTEMKFAVASTHQPIRQPYGWRMRKSQAVVAGKMPLRFRKLTTQPQQGWDGVLTGLEPWTTFLDKSLASGQLANQHPETTRVVQEIRDAMIAAVVESDAIPKKKKPTPPPTTLAEALAQIPETMTYSLEAGGVSETLLVLFTWHQKQ